MIRSRDKLISFGRIACDANTASNSVLHDEFGCNDAPSQGALTACQIPVRSDHLLVTARPCETNSPRCEFRGKFRFARRIPVQSDHPYFLPLCAGVHQMNLELSVNSQTVKLK